MPTSGSSTYFNSDDYRSSVRDAQIDLIFASCRNFKARLTWAQLGHLSVLRSHENLPRIAYVSLAPDQAAVAFPISRHPSQVWGGEKLSSGDIVLLGQGAHIHQKTSASSCWGLVLLSPQHLADHARTLIGQTLVPPTIARILRPSPAEKTQLLRLHAQACDLAETKPKMIAHCEITRALEQNLVHALAHCLTKDSEIEPTAVRRQHWTVMARLEELLAANLHHTLRVPDLCTAIGVDERALRRCCAEVLGMGPSHYLRLRRLNLVNSMLRRASSDSATVADIAGRCGFSELGRFAGFYRTVFGEMPSTTLERARLLTADSNSAESA